MKKRITITLFCVLHFFVCIPGEESKQLLLGLENLSDSFLSSLNKNNTKSLRIGLVTNQTGKDQQGNRNVDLLKARGLDVQYIFAPEHGFAGTVKAETKFDDAIDQKTGIPVIALYASWAGKPLDTEKVKNIDVIFFDMQESGVRYYTYLATLLNVMKEAQQYDKPVVVFDRPNMLGSCMEGPVVHSSVKSEKSMLACTSLPMRHGLTIGELATYFNKYELKDPANLHVVKMQNFNREKPSADNFITPLSPNITSAQACYGYSFLGLCGEVRPFELGVRGPLAFQCVMIPEEVKLLPPHKWRECTQLIQRHGVNASPYSDYKKGILRKKLCHGVRLHIDDIQKVSGFSLFMDLTMFFKQAGIDITFSKYFDVCSGTPSVREVCLGKKSMAELKKEVNTGLTGFFAQTKSCLLYEGAPKIIWF